MVKAGTSPPRFKERRQIPPFNRSVNESEAIHSVSQDALLHGGDQKGETERAGLYKGKLLETSFTRKTWKEKSDYERL